MKRLNFFERPTHPVEQFVRYLIAGGIGTVIEIVLFALLAWQVFPALREDEWVVRLFDLPVAPIAPTARAFNFAVCLGITFVVSNLVGYFLNAVWVFVPGRLSRRNEIIAFYFAALFSYILGTICGMVLIATGGVSSITAYLVTAAVSILVNYTARKYLIFKG
jgi:putative flippase GtrA